MGKLIAIVLCLLCLSPAASAEETKYAALIVCGGPNGAATEKLLDGLEDKGVKVTYFLQGENLAHDPDAAKEMAAAGHELGIQGYGADSMEPLCRRAIAKSFSDTRVQIPQPVRFLYPPEGVCTDGVRQVAEVTGLAIIGCERDIQGWAKKEGYAPVVELVQDGDVVLLSDASLPAANTSLAMVDALKQRGFRFVTISELARRRNVLIHPGRIYTAFPPAPEDE